MKSYTHISFDDGATFKLPDISYEKFMDSTLFTSGASDLAYDAYLLKNGMCTLSDFNAESLNQSTLVDEQPHRERVLKFRLVYDSDNDPAFNAKEYPWKP